MPCKEIEQTCQIANQMFNDILKEVVFMIMFFKFGQYIAKLENQAL